MRVTEPEARGLVRRALFDPLANAATPFYAGMPSFRQMLWLAGERPGEFLELWPVMRVSGMTSVRRSG